MTAVAMAEALAVCAEKLSRVDPSHQGRILGLATEGRSLLIPFYDQTFRIEAGRMENLNGAPPTDAVALVLCRYLLGCPQRPVPRGRLLTFRELKGAGPLVTRFADNTNKLITSAFATDMEALVAAGEGLKGKRQPDAPGYDLLMTFQALPRIPVHLKFNAADEQFPAQCGIFFNQSAEHYLDMHALFTLGTYLAGGLIGHGNSIP